MAKEQTWQITVNGEEHTVTYVRQGLRSGPSTLFVDDGEGRLFRPRDGYVDVPVIVGGKECRFVMRGYNADLAVDGVFVDSGRDYRPIADVPTGYRVVTVVCLVLYFFLWRTHMWTAIVLAGVVWLCTDRAAHSETMSLKAKKRCCLLLPLLALLGSILVQILL